MRSLEVVLRSTGMNASCALVHFAGQRVALVFLRFSFQLRCPCERGTMEHAALATARIADRLAATFERLLPASCLRVTGQRERSPFSVREVWRISCALVVSIRRLALWFIPI